MKASIAIRTSKTEAKYSRRAILKRLGIGAGFLPLLSTDYLRRPLAPGLEAEIEELTLAVPEVLAEERIDLAAEIALALQAAGEVEIAEHHDLLARLAARQHPDGSVADPSTAGVSVSEAARLRVHTTGVALVALAYMAT